MTPYTCNRLRLARLNLRVAIGALNRSHARLARLVNRPAPVAP